MGKNTAQSMFQMLERQQSNHFRRWVDILLIDLGSIAKRKIRTKDGLLVGLDLDRLEAIANGTGAEPAVWEKELITQFVRDFPDYPNLKMEDIFPSQKQYEAFERLNGERMARARSNGYHPKEPNLEQMLLLVQKSQLEEKAE